MFGPILDRLDRVQRAFWFKVCASAVVVVLGIGFVGWYTVRLAAIRRDSQITVIEAPPPETPAEVPSDPEQAKQLAEYEKAMRAAQKTAAEATARALNSMRDAQTDPTVIIVGTAAITGILLGVIWLGIGLTSFAFLGLVALVAVPMMIYGRGTFRDIGRFIAGIGSLGLTFFVLMELLRLAFGAPNSVLAIARNVVSEAVRIKVSLVFIVLLLAALAALPGLLDPSTPLRYRVQSFLQYGSAGSFWIIAILTIVLAVSSVAFEQRDRVIWQTMTKPVAPWQYILGKWLGVVGVAAVLLAVSSTGVFLFTRYLQDQKAIGEVAPYQPAKEGEAIVEDRLVLESQVLAARKSAKPLLPPVDTEALAREIEQRVAKLQATDENYKYTESERVRLLSEFDEQRRSQYFAIEPGQREIYVFEGLKQAKEAGSPISLRYKVDLGANDPRSLLRITFVLENTPPIVQEIPLGQAMTLPISPAALRTDGTLAMQVFNGDFYRWRDGEQNFLNTETISFPPGGLEIYYSAGSYQANFLRVVVVAWLKIAFLAMVAILAATFLSFAVAALVSFGTFLIAESAGFLFSALEYYDSAGPKGEIIYHRAAIRAIAVPISRMFQFYAQLKPAESLVDGRMIGWDRVFLTAAILGCVTAVLYFAAVAIFRRRELAMYSGQ